MKAVILLMLVAVIVAVHAGPGRWRHRNSNGRRPDSDNPFRRRSRNKPKYDVINNNLSCPPPGLDCKCNAGERACDQCNFCFCTGSGTWGCHWMMCPPPPSGKQWAMVKFHHNNRTRCRPVDM